MFSQIDVRIKYLESKDNQCRSQYIKNICTFRANLAIGKDDAVKTVMAHINSMAPQWRWDVEEMIRRST